MPSRGHKATTVLLDDLNNFVVKQIYPQLIQDAFFTKTPLMNWVQRQSDRCLPAHVDGELCVENIACEECYK